jgi:hypothetical protein
VLMSEGASQLSLEGERLLALRLSGLAGTRIASQPQAKPDMRFPLSSDQRRLWFIDQADPENRAYNVHAAYRLRGELDSDALCSAVSHVMGRHDVLHARFLVDAGEPYQIVSRTPDAEVSVQDFSGEHDPLAAAREFGRASADTHFKLDSGPLFHTWLARLGEHDRILGIVVHHIAFDRVSLRMWEAEVSAAYTAVRSGFPPRLPPLAAQYGDHVRWQRLEAARGGDRQLEYWRRRLRGVPVATEVPLDYSRPKRPSYRADSTPIRLLEEQAGTLRAIAKSQHTTMFTVALAGLQGLLFRYSPDADTIVVGCPVSGRVRPEFENLIGFFTRSLPIVATHSHYMKRTFSDIVAETRDSLLEAHENQDVSFDELVRIAAPPRDLGHNPVFQIWFDLVSQPPGSTHGMSLPDLVVTEFDAERLRTRFDIEVHLAETPSGELHGRLLSASDLFEPSTVAGFVRHYENFLSAIAEKPDIKVSDIPILAADELDTIVNQWSTAS